MTGTGKHTRRLGSILALIVLVAACGSEPEQEPIPTSAPVLTTNASEFTTTTTTIPPGPVLYEIQPGDTLSAVADQFSISVDQLLQANPTITDPGLISVGQTILIPEIAPAPEDGDGLQIPDLEEPQLPALTSTTTTTEPLATTSTVAGG